MSYNNQYPWEGPIDPDDYPEASATQPEKRPEISIQFGKGLVEEPFTSRAGKELVEIKIPNRDPLDKSPWESFVVPANFVHDNPRGKGVWIRLPADGMTRVSRSDAYLNWHSTSELSWLHRSASCFSMDCGISADIKPGRS